MYVVGSGNIKKVLSETSNQWCYPVTASMPSHLSYWNGWHCVGIGSSSFRIISVRLLVVNWSPVEEALSNASDCQWGVCRHSQRPYFFADDSILAVGCLRNREVLRGVFRHVRPTRAGKAGPTVANSRRAVWCYHWERLT